MSRSDTRSSNTMATIKRFLHYSKYLGLLLVLAGIPTMIVDDSAGSQMPLLTGLFILLVTTNRTDDERSAQIKTSSLYLAFIVAYAIKLLLSNLQDHNLTAFVLVEIDHFIILILALANAIYYSRLHIIKA